MQVFLQIFPSKTPLIYNAFSLLKEGAGNEGGMGKDGYRNEKLNI